LRKRYELIEHTADFGIKVKGRSLSDVFRKAALALFDIIAEKKPDTHPRQKILHIKQTAATQEELFINWLNELLSLSQTKEVIFTRFQVEKLTATLIKARAIGRDVRGYRVNTEVKAATYHTLALTKTAAGWQARVIFDA